MKKKNKVYVSIQKEIIRRTDLNANSKVLFGFLCGYTLKYRDIGTNCWDAYMKKIAVETGMSMKTVGRAARELEEHGLISREWWAESRKYLWSVHIDRAIEQWEQMEYLKKLNKGRSEIVIVDEPESGSYRSDDDELPMELPDNLSGTCGQPVG